MIEALVLAATAAAAIATVVLLRFARPSASSVPLRLAAALVIAAVSGALLLFGLAAAAAVAMAAALVSIAMPRYWHVSGSVFFSTLLVAFGVYGAYLVRATFLLGGEPLGLVLGTVLLVFELVAIVLLVTGAFEMVDALAAAPPVLPAVPEPARWPVVCLQVPTYNEPPELVIETVRSLVALDYPALRVQVIDNNTTDEALWRPLAEDCAKLAAEGHRVEFVHLPSWPGYKAGALNWGLAHLADDVEIIGIVDADYVVDPGWLRATVPYFMEARVAFVQTPQDYRAWEESAFYRASYAGFALFFKIGMVSRSRRNSIIFAGTMGLVRRRALEAIGGWDERIITEDAEVSLRMLRLGWRAIYVPTAYGRGIMPLTYEGLRKQRFRWAFGGIQILRRHWRSLMPWNRRSGLTQQQRYDHLMGGLWWFNDALTLIFTLFVSAAALGAILDRPFVVQRLSGVGIVLPVAFIGLNLVRYIWATGAATGAGIGLALAALRVNMSLSWVIALACLRGLTQQRGVFLRTPKFQGAPAIREMRLVWVEATLAVTLLALLAFVTARAAGSPVSGALIALLAWSLLIYGSAVTHALSDPAREPLTAALRHKAVLELRPRVGRAARSRATRVGVGALLAAMLIAVGVANESGRAPVADLPFAAPPGAVAGSGGRDPMAVLPRATPTATPSAEATSLPTPTAAIGDEARQADSFATSIPVAPTPAPPVVPVAAEPVNAPPDQPQPTAAGAPTAVPAPATTPTPPAVAQPPSEVPTPPAGAPSEQPGQDAPVPTPAPSRRP